MSILVLIGVSFIAFSITGMGLWAIVHGIHLMKKKKMWKKIGSCFFFLCGIGSIVISSGILLVMFLI